MLNVRKTSALCSAVLALCLTGLIGCPNTGGTGGSVNRNAVVNRNGDINANVAVNENVAENSNTADNVNADDNANEPENANAEPNENAALNANNGTTINTNTNAGPTNQAPIADAGQPQTVSAGAQVTLNGSASTDPDGDPLTFAWEQIGGLSVTLTGGNTATPTFPAPELAGTLAFALTVSDGLLSSAPAVVTVSVTVAAIPTLFVVNSITNGGSVAGFADPAVAAGNALPTTLIAGAATGLSTPLALLVDDAGALLVLNFVGPTLTVYDGAVTAAGNLAPSRTLVGPNTLQGTPNALALGAGGTLLFVANFDDSVEVYDMVGTPSFAGNLPFVRRITRTTAMIDPLGLALDADDNLYVANTGEGGNPNILVFAGASGLDGESVVARTIQIVATPALFAASLVDVFLDNQDRLFVVNSSQLRVFIFDNASTRLGMENPTGVLEIPGAGQLSAITVGSDGTGYIADRMANAIYVYSSIATRTGMIPPDATIQGANTQLNMPNDLFVFEP